YNGYKVYWNDGGQLVAPHDKNVIGEVQKINDVTDINFEKNSDLIKILGKETDQAYLQQVVKQSISPEIIEKQKNLKIVFTPIHGTGVKFVPDALRAYGFETIYNVPEQDVVDGNFPTVHSPNPEEPAALKMALEKAQQTDADLVMATDPDSDRVGIAVKNQQNKFVLLNGNQTASLIIYYLLSQWKEKGLLQGKEYIVKTIVTSELLKDIAQRFNTDCYDVLTGFKFIGEKIRLLEGKKQFIGGGEESYGYLIGDYARDKDAVVSSCIIAETMAWAKENGKTLYQMLQDLYVEFGFYKEKLISVTKKGKEGMEEIQKMMDDFREQPPVSLGGNKISVIKDYLSSKQKDVKTGKETNIDLPQSNVLQFFTEEGSKITVRPSGTEPKIKFYFGIKGEIKTRDEFEEVNSKLETHIQKIVTDLGL
ncbi:MAG: phospho-sugar mutase, partial [Bacteroidota bacterium]